MKLNEFIKATLLDIDSALHDVSKETGRDVSVTTEGGKRVSFDVAVTTSSSITGEATGKGRIGIVEVLGVGVDAKGSAKRENSEVSRIQFTVHVPWYTREESSESLRQAAEASSSGGNWLDKTF